jgi:hypothetical protein
MIVNAVLSSIELKIILWLVYPSVNILGEYIGVSYYSDGAIMY